ncbi:MAG: hypothetical protein A2Y33_01765 [Spirochaetes bacterium GWF1_51_8]|nr:MAG: hypothetical protein A2Y33_01765 [Spirochaetes bacterium GWF1_51_8]
MRKLRNSLIFIFLFSGSVFGVNATINEIDAPIYKNPMPEAPMGNLQIGMNVKIEKEQGDYYLISNGWLRGWIAKKSLTPFTPVYSNVKEKIILGSRIYTEGEKNYLVYYYNNTVYKMDIVTHQIVNAVEVGPINALHASHHGEYFLVEGAYTNETDIYTYRVLNLKSGKIVFVGVFDHDKSYVFSIDFSGNDRYFVMSCKHGEKKSAAVFETERGEFISYANQIENVEWLSNTLVMNNKDYFWACDFDKKSGDPNMSFRPEFQLTAVSKDWIVEGVVEYEIFGKSIYINTKKGVLSFNTVTKELGATPYNGLLIDSSGGYNYFLTASGGNMKDVAKNVLLKEFAGGKPQYKFEMFIKDSILYFQTKDKIESLYLYNPAMNYTYKYKTISEVMAWNEQGIIAESFGDKNVIMIAIENPMEKKFSFLVLKD